MARHEKCVVRPDGKWFDQCDGVQACMDEGWGDIRLQPMTRFTDDSKRLTMVIGKFKKHNLQVNYCPICGENVETNHPEEEKADG